MEAHGSQRSFQAWKRHRAQAKLLRGLAPQPAALPSAPGPQPSSCLHFYSYFYFGSAGGRLSAAELHTLF